MLFSNISQPRQKLLLRVSALLNLCLLLYLSLSAGWSVAWVRPGPGAGAGALTSDTDDLAQHQTFSRGILNKYFGKLGIKTKIYCQDKAFGARAEHP